MSLEDQLRDILKCDVRFDVRFNNNLELIDAKATKELHKRDSKRLDPREKPGNKLGRSHFEDIWSVFIRENPQYYLQVHACCSKYTCSNLNDMEENGSNRAAMSSLEDMETTPGMCASAFIIARRRVRHVTDNIAQCRQDELLRRRFFIGNNSLAIVGRFKALEAALSECVNKGYYPLHVQVVTKDLPKVMKAGKKANLPNAITIKLHSSCLELASELIAMSQLQVQKHPEYYNILGLKQVFSKTEKLHQVTGKVSEFIPWADEVHAKTAVGKYTCVMKDDVIKYEVLRDSNSLCMTDVKDLAREAQTEGFILARGGDSGQLFHREKMSDIRYDSQRPLRKETLPNGACMKKHLPGIRQAVSTVEKFIGEDPFSKVEVPECFDVIGEKISGMNIKEVLMEQQPSHTLR